MIIKSNRSDIAVKDNKRKTSLRIDTSVPTDNYKSVKEYKKKKGKYIDLKIEIEKNVAS